MGRREYNFMLRNNKEILRGKIPNVERCETFQSKEPVKPLNSKRNRRCIMDSVFDELGLVGKLATSSRTSHREIPRSNKIGRCKVCKGSSSLRQCDQVTQPKVPLDSAAIYTIIRSPNKHLKTGKRKT
jgi:hypothetical protein